MRASLTRWGVAQAGSAWFGNSTPFAWFTCVRGREPATQFRSGIDLAYEAGDARIVLSFLDIYAQALATTERAEAAALLSASAAELGPHMSNPISVAHRRETIERLLTQLDANRFAELTAHGATLGYDEAVALARAELDRVIANDNDG